MTKDKSSSLQLPIVQDIILDTCILQYISNKFISTELIRYLFELTTRKFALAISDISIWELLTGTTVKQEQEAIETLKLFKRYQLSIQTLIGASQLCTLYQHEHSVSHTGISMQDTIIASTAVLTGSVILTANISDFPRPFFHEAEEKIITYRKKDKTNWLVLQILRPNHPVIQHRFANRPK